MILAAHPIKKSTNVRSLMKRATAEGMHGLELISPAFAARVAEEIFLTPRHARRPIREREALQGAAPFRLRTEGEHLAAWSWGSGPAVVLLHGWAGRGSQLSAFVDPLVARGYRVITFDVRAHGDSPGRQATLADFRRGLEAVHREVGHLHAVVAHSFGAAAMWSAIDRGVIAQKLVAIAPIASLEAGIRRFASLLDLDRATTDHLIDRIEDRTGTALVAAEPLELAPKVAIPLLVIHDRRDRQVHFSEGEALAKATPRAVLHSTSSLGHTRLLFDPGVVETVVEFLVSEVNELTELGGSAVPLEAWRLERFLFDRDRRE
jgi:pimeloyl-ACP methyl ester carboxylesterase